MTTTRTITNRLTRALRDRMISLVDVQRPEGPLFLAATIGTEVAKATGSGPLEKACKPLIAPAATAMALREGTGRPVDTALLSLAGAAYTTGDVILMLGGGHASRTPARLIRGAAAFGVGHLALGAVMLRSGIRPQPVQMSLHGAVGGTVGSLLLKDDPAAGAPIAGYAALLSSLSALATSVGPREVGGATVLAVGGPLFLLSDALIMIRRKAEPGTVPSRLLDVAVIDSYALAVLLLLTGTAAAARAAADPRTPTEQDTVNADAPAEADPAPESTERNS